MTPPENPKRVSAPYRVELPPHGVSIVESHHGEDFHMEWTEHAFDKILCVIAGRGRMIREGRATPLPLAPMELLVVPATRRHRLEDSEPVSLYALCLTRSFRDNFPDWKGFLAEGSIRRTTAPEALLGRIFRRLLFEQTIRPTGWRLSATALSLELMTWLVREHPRSAGGPASNPPERVRRYVEQLHESFFMNEDLDAVARRLDLSRRRFTALFRECTGESWLQYQRRLRIRHACRLLEQGNRSIAAVAFETGFRDLAHFYRAFKQATGTSPGRWRERGPG